MRLLLDADILIGALDSSDAHHDRARELFVLARERQDPLSISVVNLTEVLIAIRGGRHQTGGTRNATATAGVDPSRIRVAGAIKQAASSTGTSFEYLLATAKQTGSTIASFDRKVRDAAEREGLITA